MSESRRCHRMRVSLPILIEVGTSKDGIIGHTTNLSATGFALKVKEPMEVGGTHTFSLNIDPTKVITLEAQIVWVTRKWQGVHREFDLGAKIVGGAEDQLREYVRFVAQKMIELFKTKTGDDEETQDDAQEERI